MRLGCLSLDKPDYCSMLTRLNFSCHYTTCIQHGGVYVRDHTTYIVTNNRNIQLSHRNNIRQVWYK